MATATKNRPRDAKGRFKPYRHQTEREPVVKTTPLFPDLSEGFSALVQVGLNVLHPPDIAIRTDQALAREMLRDPQVAQPLKKRRLATAQLDWQIVPDDDTDSKQVEVADELTRLAKKTPRTVDMFEDLLMGTFKGTGVSIMQWAQDDDNAWYVAHHQPENGDKILWTKWGEPHIRVRQQQSAGRPLTQAEHDQMILYIYNREAGDFFDPATAAYVYAGRGLRDEIWYYWWMKHQIVKYWINFLERFGTGFVMGRYPMGNKRAKDAVESVLQNLMNDSKVSVPVPKGAEDREAYGVEVVDHGGKGTTVQAFHQFVEDWAGKHIRLMIVGQQEEFRESGDGLGSGRSETMRDIFRMYRDFDAVSLGETLTEHWIRRLQFHNFGRLPFQCRFRFILDDDDYEEQERRFKAAKDLGLPVVKADAYKALGLAEPQVDDEVLEFGGFGDNMDEDGNNPLAGLFSDIAPQRMGVKTRQARKRWLDERN